jgi:dTMP kinase
MNSKGHFIVLEGIDGSGTTSQAQKLKSYLESKSCSVVTTFEPSKDDIGKMVRGSLTGARSAFTEPATALLFAADRLQHINDVILPAIKNGQWVISDRYVLSSLAYQSIHCDPQWVAQLNSLAQKPDYTFFLDISVQTSLSRMQQAERTLDRYENETLLDQVHKAYHRFLDHPLCGPLSKINGEQTLEAVTQSLTEHISEKFNV